jgi:hypothetical protein
MTNKSPSTKPTCINRRAALVVAGALAMLLQVHSAAADVLTRCGASSGVTYYFEGSVMTADKAGWQHDAVTGSFELIGKCRL